MFKMVGKEITAILGAQTILIWTHDCTENPNRTMWPHDAVLVNGHMDSNGAANRMSSHCSESFSSAQNSTHVEVAALLIKKKGPLKKLKRCNKYSFKKVDSFKT